jgi:hypothetical protein
MDASLVRCLSQTKFLIAFKLAGYVLPPVLTTNLKIILSAVGLTFLEEFGTCCN